MKMKIITFLTTACIAFTLAGCAQSAWLYRVNIQQGNIITSESVHQIHLGMSKEAISDLLGPPVLIDAFNDNRWTYIYSFKPGKGSYLERELVIYFQHDRIVRLHTKNIK